MKIHLTMSSSEKRQQKLLLIFIKVIVLISITSSLSKLSQQSIDHTTYRLGSDNSRSNRGESVDSARLSLTAKGFDVPIFLMDPSTHEISVTEWKAIAKQWKRDTQYADIIQSDHTIDATIPFPQNKQVLIFHHLMPKTASSTLRQSCQDTQLETCGIEPKGAGNKRPDGYMTVKRLIQVMNECPKTRHYCVKSDTQPLIRNYTQFHESNSFLHLFPFRNYDEWVHSALKQVYFRDGEKGCQEEDALLDQCLPHQYELDFDRYGKSSLSYFLGSWRRLRQRNLGFEDNHMVLMYDYRYLHETLESLNAEYDIPLLPGTDAKKNSERPEGTCKDEDKMIEKFHDCFSDGLDEIE